MFVANLALGLYIHLGPRLPTSNTTVDLTIVALEGSRSGSYLMLVPLFATMLFIMGMCCLGFHLPGYGQE